MKGGVIRVEPHKSETAGDSLLSTTDDSSIGAATPHNVPRASKHTRSSTKARVPCRQRLALDACSAVPAVKKGYDGRESFAIFYLKHRHLT